MREIVLSLCTVDIYSVHYGIVHYFERIHLLGREHSERYTHSMSSTLALLSVTHTHTHTHTHTGRQTQTERLCQRGSTVTL
jgi:hypothetical protein